MEYDYKIKVVLCGNTNVGKSTFFSYIQDRYIKDHTPTIGVDFFSSTQKFKDYFVKLNIWDTAGQEKFRSIIGTYFKDVSCFILMFDLSNLDSLNDLEYWIGLINHYSTCEHNHPIFLLGSKRDLVISENTKFKKIDKHLIDDFIDKHNIVFYQEISTIYQDFIPQQIIYDIIEEVLKNPQKIECKGININENLKNIIKKDIKKNERCCVIS